MKVKLLYNPHFWFKGYPILQLYPTTIHQYSPVSFPTGHQVSCQTQSFFWTTVHTVHTANAIQNVQTVNTVHQVLLVFTILYRLCTMYTLNAMYHFLTLYTLYTMYNCTSVHTLQIENTVQWYCPLLDLSIWASCLIVALYLWTPSLSLYCTTCCITILVYHCFHPWYPQKRKCLCSKGCVRFLFLQHDYLTVR